MESTNYENVTQLTFAPMRNKHRKLKLYGFDLYHSNYPSVLTTMNRGLQKQSTQHINYVKILRSLESKIKPSEMMQKTVKKSGTTL